MVYDGFYYGKDIISLSPNEYKILELLSENKNKILKYEEVQKKLKIKKHDIYVYVNRLRKKLKDEFKIYTKVNVGIYI